MPVLAHTVASQRALLGAALEATPVAFREAMRRAVETDPALTLTDQGPENVAELGDFCRRSSTDADARRGGSDNTQDETVHVNIVVCIHAEQR